MPDLSVLICSARRPAWLEALVASIAADAEGRPALELVIVDNDPAASALPVLERLARGPLTLVHRHLPEPNIARARNLALALARAPRVLFLDDDQLVRRGFFAALEEAWRKKPHWAVGLRCRVAYLDDLDAPLPPPGAYHVPPGYPIDRERFGSGGLMIARAALLALGAAPFDPAFGLSGGEDTELLRRLDERRLKVVWRPEVSLIERRSTRRGPLQRLRRAFGVGVIQMRIVLRHDGVAHRPRQIAGRVLHASARSLLRLVRPRRYPGSRAEPVEFARLLGELFVLAGGRWEPYRRKRN